MELIRKSTAIFDKIMDAFMFLSCVILSFVALSICLEVVMRYFLDRPQVWVVEISEYSLLYIAFLGAAWLLREEGHVTMDFLLNRTSPRNAAMLNVVTSIISAIICLVLVWYGVKITWYNFEGGFYIPTILKPPKYVLLLIIPIGSFLLFIQFLRRAYKYLRVGQRELMKYKDAEEKQKI